MGLQSKEEYLSQEKVEHQNVSMYPSVRTKALRIAKKIFGTDKNKFSTVISVLINDKYRELFGGE